MKVVNRVLDLLRLAAALLMLAAATYAQDIFHPLVWEQFPGPPCAAINQWNSFTPPAACDNHQVNEWLRDIEYWRAERRIRVEYDGTLYQEPALRWTQSNFIQPQMMIHDRYFYDPFSRRYHEHKLHTNETYPAGWASKPVARVSLENARACAQWEGKRLPYKWEWQYLAQGTDGRQNPWDNQWP